MKRFFILASAAIVALASCAKTEVVYKGAPEKITFKQVTDVMTKADPVYLSGTLGVYAYQDGTKHLDNFSFVEGTGANDNVWANDDAYWPYEGTLDFIVYAPHSSNASYGDNKLTVSGVTAADALYYGSKKYTDVTKQSAYPVSLKHMSSKITVNITASSPYELTSLTLAEVVTTGTVQVDYTDANTPKVSTTSGTPGDIENITTGAINYVLPGSQTYFVVAFKQGDLAFTKKIELSENWVANTAYTYNITLSSAEKITFSATVDDWSTASPVDKTQGDLSDYTPLQ